MSQDEIPKDHVDPSYHYNEERPRFEDNIKSKATWLRLFFMIVVCLLWGVSRVVIAAVIIIQFLWVLFTGEVNPGLKHLGEQLARYSYQILRYLTFNAEERPFPFDLDWPSTRAVERTEE